LNGTEVTAQCSLLHRQSCWKMRLSVAFLGYNALVVLGIAL
jgi:hypothetical protein